MEEEHAMQKDLSTTARSCNRRDKIRWARACAEVKIVQFARDNATSRAKNTTFKKILPPFTDEIKYLNTVTHYELSCLSQFTCKFVYFCTKL